MIFPLAASLCMLFYSCNDDDDNAPARILVEVPDVQIACEGVTPVTMDDADITLSGADCSEAGLRSAVEQGGKIACDCGGATINITSEMEITTDVTIDGGGVILDGGGNTRIFNKLPNPDVDLTLQNITLQNGRSYGGEGSIVDRSGGLILARSYSGDMAMGGNLVCINVTFEDSRTDSFTENDVAGGAVYVFGVAEAIFSECTFNNNRSSNGGAIGNLGSDLIVINSVFSNNEALGNSFLAGFGGAIYVDGVASGGLNDVYTVCGTQFVNNQSVRSGGATASIVSDNFNTLASFDQCTFSQNRAGSTGEDNLGGAIYHIEDENQGAGAEHNFSLTNSILMNNEAQLQGGGVWIIIDGIGTIANTTFYQNGAVSEGNSLAGAIAFAEGGYGGDYLVTNCTFAENFTNHFSAGMYISADNFVTFNNNVFYNNLGTFRYAGHLVNGDGTIWGGEDNLQYPKVFTNSFGEEISDFSIHAFGLDPLITEDPLLLPPAANGGFTFTMALQPGSPAINAGNPATSTPVDQRGVTRGAVPDLGAYEVEE